MLRDQNPNPQLIESQLQHSLHFLQDKNTIVSCPKYQANRAEKENSPQIIEAGTLRVGN